MVEVARALAVVLALAVLAPACGVEESAAPAPGPSPQAAPEPAPAAPDPEQALREEAAARLRACWEAAGLLARIERDLPEKLSSRLAEAPDGGGPSPLARMEADATRVKRLLREPESRPLLAGAHPELTAALNTAVRSLADAAREYEKMAAALRMRGISLAERARKAARFHRGEGVEALRTAIPAAFIARVPGAYEVDGEGGVWRCAEGTWREGGTDRARGPCEEGAGGGAATVGPG